MRDRSRNRDPEATAQAKRARQSPSVVEEIVWRFLRGNRTGFHFRREVPILSYRVDFYSAEAALAVELDGEQHDPIRDTERDSDLRRAGVEVFRIPNTRFFQLDGEGADDPVLRIVRLCEARSGRRAADRPGRRSRKPG